MHINNGYNSNKIRATLPKIADRVIDITFNFLFK